jgi:phosphoglycolate phosphatase
MTPALIFDLDGTLVDTAPDLLATLNALLAREGRPPLTPSDMRHLVGFGARVMLAEAFKMTGGPAEPVRFDALFDAYIADYKAHIADTSRPFPGVEDTLTALAAQGARMGVLTNKPQLLTDALLGQLGLDRHFAAAYGQGRRPYMKPDPRIFADVLREVGGAGLGALMIGDSITDVETGRAAGVPVILVSFGYSPRPARTLGADAVVDDFREIPKAVRRLLAEV